MIDLMQSQIDRWVLYPLDELTTPSDEKVCLLNHWWGTVSDSHALFYLNYNHPFCNSSRVILESLKLGHEEIFKDMKLKFIPVAYMPQMGEQT